MSSKLNPDEVRTLRRLLQSIELFLDTQSDARRDMPIQALRLYLMTALNEAEEAPAGVVEMAAKAGLPLSVASRHMIDLGEVNRYKEAGFDLVEQRINLHNRRERPAHLTTKGRSMVSKLARVWGPYGVRKAEEGAPKGSKGGA